MAIIKRDMFEHLKYGWETDQASDDPSVDFLEDGDETYSEEEDDGYSGEGDDSFSEEDDDSYSDGQFDYYQGIAEALAKLTVNNGPLASLVHDLVVASLSRVLGELDKKELIEKAIKKAFEDVELTFALSLHVSPVDHEIAERQIRNIDKSIPVFDDPLLSAGEVVVDTPKGRIHIGAREQIVAIAEALEQDFHDGE